MSIQRKTVHVPYTASDYEAFRAAVIAQLGRLIIFRSDQGRRARELIEQVHGFPPFNASESDLRVIYRGLEGDHQTPGGMVQLILELVSSATRVELLFVSHPIHRPPQPFIPPDPQPAPQEIERQINRLVRHVQDGIFPPTPGSGDDRFGNVARYLSHIEGYMKAMKAIQDQQYRTPPLLPNVDAFYPSRLHFERPGFQKAVDAWRELGDPSKERQRNPPHACVDDSAIQTALLRDENFGRVNSALSHFYENELRRYAR